MNIDADRIYAVQKLLNVRNHDLIKKIIKLIDEESDITVLYSSGGQPMNNEQYQKDIEDALAQVKSGNLITQKELEFDSESW